jgi:hypothetical protein
MTTKNNGLNNKGTRKYTKIADYVIDDNNMTSRSTLGSVEKNLDGNSQNVTESTSDYVSGDSSRSSSSHQFHKNSAE